MDSTGSSGRAFVVMAALSLPKEITITSARVVAAGAFTLPAAPGPGAPGAAPNFKDVPEFCRVRATASPSADSNIAIEIWLPAATWNGKFQRSATASGAAP